MELGAPQVTCVSLSPSASPEGLPPISELEQGGTPGEVRAVQDSIDSILLGIMDYNRSIHTINIYIYILEAQNVYIYITDAVELTPVGAARYARTRSRIAKK